MNLYHRIYDPRTWLWFNIDFSHGIKAFPMSVPLMRFRVTSFLAMWLLCKVSVKVVLKGLATGCHVVVSQLSHTWHQLESFTNAHKVVLTSVECSPGGWKIDHILSISEIQSLIWYHCIQYTKHHLMNLVSDCLQSFCKRLHIWICYIFLRWPARQMACTAGHLDKKNNLF